MCSWVTVSHLPDHYAHLLISSIQSSDTPKPKDPPWLALVKQESKKKLAPSPPRAIATPPQSASTPSKTEEETRPATPPNPFDDDTYEEAEAKSAEMSGPSSVVAVHPWYGISQNAEVTSESPTHTEHPGSGRSKKRPAPRAPKSVPSGQWLLLTGNVDFPITYSQVVKGTIVQVVKKIWSLDEY